MTLYALRRLGLALVIVVCAMVVLFGMIHLVPGDPITIAPGPYLGRSVEEGPTATVFACAP